MTEELLWTMADETNRRVLQYFKETENEEVSFDELAAYVAERHSSISPTREMAAVRLRHRSLPKLVNHNLVECDSDTKIVRSGRVLPPDFQQQVFELDEE